MSPAHAGNSKVNTSRPRFASGFCELSVHPAAVAPFPSLRSSLAPRVDASSVKTVHGATGCRSAWAGPGCSSRKTAFPVSKSAAGGSGRGKPPREAQSAAPCIQLQGSWMAVYKKALLLLCCWCWLGVGLLFRLFFQWHCLGQRYLGEQRDCQR